MAIIPFIGAVKGIATVQVGSRVGRLAGVLNEKPEQYHEEAMGVLRCLVAIRDHLIEQRRRSPSAELDERLDHVNAVMPGAVMPGIMDTPQSDRKGSESPPPLKPPS